MKKFEITKEQILELASKDESCKEILKEAFPDVLEPRIDIEKMPDGSPHDFAWDPEFSLINDIERVPLIWVSKSTDHFVLSNFYKWNIITKDGIQRLTFK